MVHSLPAGLLELAGAQNGALLGTQIASFVGDRRLLRLTHDGTLNKLWRNAYAVPDQPPGTDLVARGGPELQPVSPQTRLSAARLSLGRPVTACLHTAAEIHGFDIAQERRTHILAAGDWPSQLGGLVQHRPELVRHVQRVHGETVTDLAETAARIAAIEKNPARVLAVLDAALRCTDLAPDDLACVAGELRIRGIKLVREVIPLADGKAESPGESWLRWVCFEAGLPTPTLQVRVTVRRGRRYRIDLGWDELRIGLEYEGVQFHTGAALTKDRAKYNALERQGWLMQGVTSSMIWHDRSTLVAEIRSMFEERTGGVSP